jgi:hypothetical protein
MRNHEPTREELEEKIQEAYSLIEQEAPLLPERLYNALEGISSVFLAYKKGKGQPGWSQTLVNINKKPLFTSEQSEQVEKVFDQAGPQLVPLFGDEIATALLVGGGFADIKTGASSQLVLPTQLLSPEQISLDNLYYTITSKMDEYDEQWGEIANQLGIVQAVEARDYKGVVTVPMPPPIPPIPIPYYILGKTIFPFLNTVLDLIRLSLGNPILDFAGIRILLSFVLAILELLRGDWQNALLSSLGILSSGGVVLGFFLKVVRNAFLLIAPDLRRQLRDDVYKSSKSMLVGFLLYAFSIFSPDFIRMSVQKAFDSIRTIVDNLNEKVDMVQEKANQVAEKAGVKVTFPKIPMEMIPSMDDLENLQTIARVPEVYCSPEVQQIIQPLLLVPPLRLMLELLNIPTMPEVVAEQCATVPKGSLADSVATKIQPQIEIIPGGPLNQATKLAEQATDLAEMAKDPQAILEAKMQGELPPELSALSEDPVAALEAKAKEAVPKIPKTKSKGGSRKAKKRAIKRKTYRRRR